jgi:hypothetical protein
MKALRAFSVVGIIVIVAMLMGCAIIISPGVKVDTEAFGKTKKCAIVTIMGTKKLHAQKGLLQLFKKVPEQNTQPVLDKLCPEVIKAFRKSKHLKVKSEKRVLYSKDYKNLKADEPVQKVLFMEVELNTAKGYKFISDPQKLSKLAKDLNVDGVIVVGMNFSVSSGVAGGLGIGIKRFKVVTAVSAMAYDSDGKLVWKDAIHKSSDLADSQLAVIADVRSVDFKKLKPHAIKAGKEGLNVLVARLDDGLEGKRVGAHVATVTP